MAVIVTYVVNLFHLQIGVRRQAKDVLFALGCLDDHQHGVGREAFDYFINERVILSFG
jgi:hypothetical protein